MRDALKKIVLKAFPELEAGLHLDRYARVLAVHDAPRHGGTCERFRPRYAVDLEVLTPDGELDESYPIYEAVPLPVSVGCGQESGVFGFPEPGCLVVLGFAYGRPDHPLVRQIYPLGMSLPNVPQGAQRWQQSAAVHQDVDADGNWTRTTNATILDNSVGREVRAVDSLVQLARDIRTVLEHSTEDVGGLKTIEALGGMRLLSGGFTNISSVDNINLTTGRDANMAAGQDQNYIAGRDHSSEAKRDRNIKTGRNQTDTIGAAHIMGVGTSSTLTVGTRLEITAGDHVDIHAPTVRIHNGAGGISLLPLMIRFMDEVACALHDLADHVHGDSVVPDVQAEVNSHAEDVEELRADLDTING